MNFHAQKQIGFTGITYRLKNMHSASSFKYDKKTKTLERLMFTVCSN